MSPRNIILLVVALVAAAGTALMARSWINSERAALNARQQKPVAPVEAAQQVLVAKAALPAGRFVKAEDFRWQSWPEGPLPPTYLVKGKHKPEDLIGAVVRAGIAADEPVTDSRLVKPGDRGFMAAVLEPGYRAVSVSVNATSGIAGFVFPGDRVDLLVTHSVATDETSERKKALVTETVLREVRVVAIDQRTDDQNTAPVVARTVTFEVTPKQAEVVNIARKLGELTLSLRSLSREELQGDLAGLDTTDMEEGDAALPEEVLAVTGGRKAERVEAKIERVEPTVAEGRFTVDSEVSRLLSGIGGDVQKVTIVRGDKTKVQGFRNGLPEQERAGGASDSSGATSDAGEVQ